MLTNVSVLTREQLDRIEENRILALKKLQSKKQQKEGTIEHAQSENKDIAKKPLSLAIGPNLLSSVVNSNKLSLPGNRNIAVFDTSFDHSPPNAGPNCVSSAISTNDHAQQRPHVKRYTGNVHFELFSKTSFSVSDISIFSSIFKSIPAFKYDNEEKKWLFPLHEYANLVTLMKEFEPNATYHLIPNSILSLFSALTTEEQKITPSTHGKLSFDLSLLDEPLKNSLLPFQLAGLEYE